MSVFSVFQQVAQRQPDAPALVTLDGAVSYGTVLGLADRIAGGLLAAGVRTGDRAAVHLTNRYELVAVYYACLRVGAVIVPVSHKMSAGEVEQLITDSAPRFYFGEAAVHGPCSDVTEKSAAVERAWILDATATATATTATTRPWNDILADAPAAIREVDVDDLAAIFYTSGTTGRPKSLVLSHRTLDAGLGLTQAQGVGRADATYYMINLVNPWGVLVLLTSLRRGSPVALAETNEPDVVLRMLRAHRFGWIGGAPTTYRALLAEARAAAEPAPDLTDTRCVTGGDACPIELSREFAETFKSSLTGVYGMTETAAPVIEQPRIDAVDEPSIGWPLPGVEIRVDGEPDEAGELMIRTPSRPVGSWNGTGVDPFDRSQWLASGDIVRRRPDGCLLFVGRKKDLIMVEGYPIAPLEIERELSAHPDVAAAIAFGVPDDATGERVVALVEPEPGRDIDPAKLLEHLTGRIGAYKHPSEIIPVDRLPVLPTGKLGRQRLTADYLAAREDASRAAAEESAS
ncbi:putative coA ligase [Streptomyces scabiei 87.22]|uniref:Putative coA ligase n=1 Tax=Streptomyces scabiei (strain 87.22) TaxID=680198 RepID=C9ZED6_STRSW|nr:class I adenylate-forming enzyme family protein [Streptomyces scabiei]MDX2574213.1 class I adenylate-forming enzyme family protein [Streptomyces scabiei]MDX2651097.1 class I adenylate-forming enzyme family protein [Streptomyces scabiei]MDX2725939.1 class I adenylate-forming enzyme family protein [Streptomyces scabiei]MDX2863562.1 class I adenylate-forming enzyme family protein [Streptomyces scabiei]MDX2881486.1 class I adenylate-forming enzyme family protein [Streptomyces scabiei]